MKEKILQFKGIYTNVSEVNAPTTYCKFTDAKITSKGLEAKIDTVDLENPLKTFLTDIDYFEYITLDNDKYGVKLENGEYKSNYTHNPQKYYCIITNSTIYLYDNLNKEAIVTRRFEGQFKKAIAYDNKLYIFTSTNTYELANYDRTTNRINPNIENSNFFYKEQGIYLKPVTYTKGTNSSLELDLELERIDESEELDHTVKFIVYKTISDEEDKIPNTYILGLLDTSTNKVIEEIWFTRYYFSTYFRKKISKYRILVKGTNVNNYISMVHKDKFSVKEWNEGGLTELSNREYSEGEILSFVNDEEHIYTNDLILDETTGFESTLYDTYYLGSYLLDDGSEIPVESGKLKINTIFDYFAFKLSVNFPFTLTTKVTAFRLYIKSNKEDSYEMILNYSFYDTEPLKTILTKLDLSGIYSIQTMGYSDPLEQKSLLAFDDAKITNGIMVGLLGNKVYYPIIANGYVTKMYDLYNVIPNVYGNKLFDINGALAVASSDRVEIIDISTHEGLLFFSLKDSLGMVIKDEYDAVETPDGLILNTSKGIYSTDGQGLELISEPINDIVQKNYETSNIFYNTLKKELWYIIEEENYTIYKYSFEINVWTRVEITKKILKITKDINNDNYINTAREIYKLLEKESKVNYISLLSNLNHMSLLKSITHIDFDLDGKLEWNDQIVETNGRETKTIYKSIRNREFKDYESWNFTLLNGTLYGIEINFEIVKKINQYSE